jgi:hypothetical protein
MQFFRILSAAAITLIATTAYAASEPAPTGTDKKVADIIRKSAKDPWSVRDLKAGKPHQAVDNFRYPRAWAVCTTFYAKNSFGAYSQGFYLVFFKNNQVIDALGGPGIAPHPECGPLHSVKF